MDTVDTDYLPGQRDDPAVQAAMVRAAEHTEPGLRRLAELVDEPLPAGA